jgi:two-component system OmpR family sensor kinase
VSLRSRLLIVVLGLVIVGLAVTDVVTYRALRSFLLHRVDQQLEAAPGPVADQLDPQPDPRHRDARGVSAAVIPPGTWAVVVDAAGQELVSTPFGYVNQPATVTPPKPALKGADFSRSTPFSVGSSDGSTKYRAQVTDYGVSGGRLLVAVPLHDVIQTLHRLVFIEALASGLVVLMVAVAALLLVRAGLKPLEEFGEVAGAIAEGDLSRRVPLADSRTEVGRLGESLNAMLGHIQSAFQAREASEDRLRRFVADASHELRTPLTSIRGYAELFRRGAAERPDDLAKAMRRIEEESSRMGVLVDDLLLLARLDQGRPLEHEAVDLVRVAADAVDDARAAHPDRPLSLEAPPRLVVTGDDVRLRQVAANLLANACQHTPPGSPVEVRVAAADGEVVLEVADHGPGLEPAAAEKVFERFYRADPSRSRGHGVRATQAGHGVQATQAGHGGSGLGLSIVAAIAEAHRGRVTVVSEPGHGARFRVTLPARAPDEATTAEPTETAAPAAPAAGRDIAVGSEPAERAAISPWTPPGDDPSGP